MNETKYAEKIARIRAGTYAPGDFVLADAKDADVTGGIRSTGPRRDASGKVTGHRTRPEFLDQMRDVVAQGEIDILLGSAGNIQALTKSGTFEASGVQPAFRANETSDVWLNIRGSRYSEAPSRPYRGANLEFAPADLCLYSITFNNDVDADIAALERYGAFRREAREAGIRHFLEVFNPNRKGAVAAEEVGGFVTDSIIRLLASLTEEERPEFLKVAYNGPAAMQELASHDPSMVVGVLGGAGATHRDTFELVAKSERYGARIALFGRKINQAEDQCTMISWIRRVASRDVDPVEATRGYRAELESAGIKPDRALEDDLCITADVLKG